MNSSPKPKIIIIGETQIRLDTIKNYGIYVQTTVERTVKKDSLWDRMLKEAPGREHEDPFNFGTVTEVEHKVRVLKVETLQKDKYLFSEKLHDIDSALVKLDAYFS